MKKLIVLTCTLSLLTACGDSIEKKAGEKLAAARAAFEHNDYNEAKLQIDSIKILYPKAFDTRKEGIKLMQQVELKEQQESLVYLDSMLQVKQKEFEAIKNKYTFEKNEEYQKIGNYFWPTQTVEKNLHRSFLRFQVGGKWVTKKQVRITIPARPFLGLSEDDMQEMKATVEEFIQKED